MRFVSGRKPRNGLTYVTVILLLILAAVLYGTYIFGPIYLADWNLRRQVTGQMIKAADIGDREIREELLRQAALLKIPIDGTDASLDVSRTANQITVAYKYDRTTPVPGLENVHFEKTMTREIKRVQHLFHK